LLDYSTSTTSASTAAVKLTSTTTAKHQNIKKPWGCNR
jgi:hypothetical protein